MNFKENLTGKKKVIFIVCFIFYYVNYILHSYFINALNRFVLAIIISIRRCCIFPLPYKKDIT